MATSIEELLDQLAEFQAQRDLLEINKNDLINAVKVPEEVLAAQADANKRRQALDNHFNQSRKERYDAQTAEIKAVQDPPLPPEYVAALEAANAKRNAIRDRYNSMGDALEYTLTASKDKIDADLQAKTAAIYAQVQQRKAEIMTEFGDKASAVDANIAKLTDQIKRETVAAGKSVKGKVFHAVYVKGRVSWETDKLDGMCALIPQLREARKEGAPSVTIRKI